MGVLLEVSEQDNVWGQATQVPGLVTLNAGGFGYVRAVSCVPAGGCEASGVLSRQFRHWLDVRNKAG